MTTPRERLVALPPLSAGAHKCVEQGACVMEAVAYVAGEPWSDTPACACPVLGAFMRDWNDDLPEADRDRLLRPLVRRLVGSRSTPEVEVRRSWLAMDWLVRTNAPAWLRLTPALVPHADALTDLSPIMDAQTAARRTSRRSTLPRPLPGPLPGMLPWVLPGPLSGPLPGTRYSRRSPRCNSRHLIWSTACWRRQRANNHDRRRNDRIRCPINMPRLPREAGAGRASERGRLLRRNLVRLRSLLKRERLLPESRSC